MDVIETALGASSRLRRLPIIRQWLAESRCECQARKRSGRVRPRFGNGIHLHAVRPALAGIEPVRDELELPDRVAAESGLAEAGCDEVLVLGRRRAWPGPVYRTIQTPHCFNDMQKKAGGDVGRLFMVPGMHHCTNGPGPWNFGGRGQPSMQDDPQHDLVRALERWVELGVAPASLVAAKFRNDDPTQASRARGRSVHIRMSRSAKGTAA